MSVSFMCRNDRVLSYARNGSRTRVKESRCCAQHVASPCFITFQLVLSKRSGVICIQTPADVSPKSQQESCEMDKGAHYYSCDLQVSLAVGTVGGKARANGFGS